MSSERQVLEASLDGIILRYGWFYGPGTDFSATHLRLAVVWLTLLNAKAIRRPVCFWLAMGGTHSLLGMLITNCCVIGPTVS
jgi:hypothetical protein